MVLKRFYLIHFIFTTVEVVRPRIEIRRLDDYGEQFRPMVTSPFTLTLNEQSAILNYEGNDYSMYLKLLHYPTKPLAKFVVLADVHRKGAVESGKMVKFFTWKLCSPIQ